MKILAVGAMHGNEPLGANVINLLKRRPVKNINTLVANPRALKRNSRFIKQDLNRSFPGDASAHDYEKRRAAEILMKCRKYDIVFDFHNTYCPNNDCTFVGPQASNNLFNAANFIGLPKVIVADYDCINKYASNCISIEVSMDSQLMDEKYWYSILKEIAEKKNLPKGKTNLYKFVHRITNEEEEKYSLSKKNLKAFQPIDNKLAYKLGVKSPAYPIFIEDKFTPYNFGGLLNKVSNN